jgi:hypothetical protein
MAELSEEQAREQRAKELGEQQRSLKAQLRHADRQLACGTPTGSWPWCST